MWPQPSRVEQNPLQLSEFSFLLQPYIAPSWITKHTTTAAVGSGPSSQTIVDHETVSHAVHKQYSVERESAGMYVSRQKQTDIQKDVAMKHTGYRALNP